MPAAVALVAGGCTEAPPTAESGAVIVCPLVYPPGWLFGSRFWGSMMFDTVPVTVEGPTLVTLTMTVAAPFEDTSWYPIETSAMPRAMLAAPCPPVMKPHGGSGGVSGGSVAVFGTLDADPAAPAGFDARKK